MMRLILSIIADREPMLKSYSPRLRACGGQFAPPVCAFAQPRTHAVLFGCKPTPGFCACGEQDAHRVFFFSASRTHAAGSGCAPMLSFCFPGRGKSSGASPEHRNARKAELCSFGFSGVSLISRRFAARRAAKPASSQKKGEISERAQASSFAQKRLKS